MAKPRCSARPMWIAVAIASTILADACTQSGPGNLSNRAGGRANALPQIVQPTGSNAELVAAHQAEKAALQACLPELNTAYQAGLRGGDLLRLRQACVSRHAQITVAAVKERQLENDQSLKGWMVRTGVAAEKAEQSGNRVDALRLYKSIDENSPAIKAEAERLTGSSGDSILAPFSVNTSPENTVQRNQNILEGQGLIYALMGTRRHISNIYRVLGDDVSARRYAETSMELQTAQKQYVAEYNARMNKAAREMLIDSMRSSYESPHCWIRDFGYFGKSVSCSAPTDREDAEFEKWLNDVTQDQ